MIEILTLLVMFQVKHFIADYPLQGQYMLGKMNKENWILPLAAHTSVHAAFTFAIASIFVTPLVAGVLAIADFTIHFIVDRLKASPAIGGRFKPDQPYFWWALGADQMAHHLTHYAFIYIIITQGA